MGIRNEELVNIFLKQNSSKNIGLFNIQLVNELNSISSLKKKEKFLKLLIIELKLRKNQLEKEFFTLKSKMAKKNNKEIISCLSLKIKCSKGMLKQVEDDIKKSNITKSKAKVQNGQQVGFYKRISNYNSDSLIDQIDTTVGPFELLFSKEQVARIDDRFGVNTIDKINELNNIDNKLSYLKYLIQEYENYLNNLSIIKKEYRKMYNKNRKELYNLEEYQRLNMDIRYVRKLINNFILYFKKLYVNDNTKNHKDLQYDEIELNEAQKEIKYMIENGIELNQELNDTLIAFANYIKNIKSINKENVDKYISYIKDNIDEYYLDNKVLPDGLNYLVDVISNKISYYDKDTAERKLLKGYLNEIKNIFNNYIIDDEVKDNPYFEIINYSLQDSSNYLYIKELLKRKYRLCNLKHNGKHIIIYILDLYIDNFKRMIKNKNSDYININYLKEVYFLFTKNYSLRINDDDKKEIEMKIGEFKEYINSTLIKQKRKNAAILDIEQMRPEQFYKEFYQCDIEAFSDDVLGYYKGQVLNTKDNFVMNKDYKEAFLFGDYAYNIKEEDTITLTMYAQDFSMFVLNNSLLDRYLWQCEIQKEKIDQFTLDGLSFKLGKTYPVFAYELEFYKSGKIKELTIKKDVIKITDRYLNDIRSEKPKQLNDLYKKSVVKNGGDISSFDLYKLNSHFESILNNMYIVFLTRERLPFIYYGYSLPTDRDINKNLSELSNQLFELNKWDSREVIDIFSNKIDVNHYSNLPIPNGIYDSKLINTFNYLGLANQRMLNDLYFNQRKYTDPKRMYQLKLQYLSSYIEEVSELNKTIDYVDPSKIEMSKGKIKNRMRL